MAATVGNMQVALCDFVLNGKAMMKACQRRCPCSPASMALSLFMELGAGEKVTFLS